MTESDEENYVTFGEALEPLDEENLPRKKPVTIEDQYATDEQGRRRFHGAFTGGFSAGFFNSVGSRDGWRPQQFKSSRSNKAGGVSQRPEDFMDEEDTGEFGIAPTGIRATSEYTDHGKGVKRERPKGNNDGPIPGVPVLQEILKPVKDTIGVSLLKKMGWKPGQGVGPRVTKREKKKTRERNEKKKIYGCTLPGQELKAPESSEESDDEHDGILFAPDDYEPFRCNPKDNYFGIGYSGLDRRSILGHVNLFDAPTFHLNENNKKLSIKGQAFGVGAFEADDEDIYARDDMSKYDFALGPEKQKKTRWTGETKPRGNSLEGFVPAKNRLASKKHYSPPELPKNFKPIHVVRKTRFSPAIASLSRENAVRKGLARHELNANDRSAILGESRAFEPPNPGPNPDPQVTEPIPPPKPSTAANIITRTLNLHGREQVKERKALAPQKKSWMDKLNATSFVPGGVEGVSEAQGALKKLSEFTTESGVVEANLNMPRPFQLDEEKQKRFDKYLELKTTEKDKLSSIQPLSMTEWDREREREEFEQAERLSGKSPPTPSESSEDPMVNAAKARMFGKLTRSVDQWQPASIVCKRFNIPEPRANFPTMNTKKPKKYSVFDSLSFTDDKKFERAKETSEVHGNKYQRIENEKVDLVDSLDTLDIDNSSKSDKIRNFEVSYEKIFGKSCDEKNEVLIEEEDKVFGDKREDVEVKKDLFKAIFLSSSEDEGEEEEEEVDEDHVKSLLIGGNLQRNDSPPRGIFAEVDLDDLVRPSAEKSDKNRGESEESKGTDAGVSVVHSCADVEVVQTSEVEVSMEPEMYGPVLPTKQLIVQSTSEISSEKPVFRSVVIPKLENDGNSKWVEKKKPKEKKKKKHKHKDRDKKHKHKSNKSKKCKR